MMYLNFWRVSGGMGRSTPFNGAMRVGSPRINGPDAGEHVRRIIEELRLRCRALEDQEDVAERVRQYHDEVREFVELINAGFFSFVALLDGELRASGLGHARLVIRPEQPDLVDQLDPMQDWPARRFSLVLADLNIRLRYVVRGVEKHRQSLDAAVFFWPTSGLIQWSDGHRDRFRTHREDAFDESRFGPLDFWDFISRLGLRRMGREESGTGFVVDDPEAIVLRRICLDGCWPGWVD